MIEILINVTIFILQFIFNVLKVLEIKYTYENKIRGVVINSILINTIGLISMGFSIDGLFVSDNPLRVIPFIIGSALGKYFGMIHYENYRSKAYKLFFRNKKEN